MISIKIENNRDFTRKLFIEDVFDDFYLNKAEFVTNCRFEVDGELMMNFFDEEEQKSLSLEGRRFCLWKELKPFCYQIIKGRRAPLSFRILLSASARIPECRTLLENAVETGVVSGFVLKFEFINKEILGATGVSLNSFSLDRSLEHEWDELVPQILSSHEILFEKR